MAGLERALLLTALTAALVAAGVLWDVSALSHHATTVRQLGAMSHSLQTLRFRFKREALGMQPFDLADTYKARVQQVTDSMLAFTNLQLLAAPQDYSDCLGAMFDFGMVGVQWDTNKHECFGAYEYVIANGESPTSSNEGFVSFLNLELIQKVNLSPQLEAKFTLQRGVELATTGTNEKSLSDSASASECATKCLSDTECTFITFHAINKQKSYKCGIYTGDAQTTKTLQTGSGFVATKHPGATADAGGNEGPSTEVPESSSEAPEGSSEEEESSDETELNTEESVSFEDSGAASGEGEASASSPAATTTTPTTTTPTTTTTTATTTAGNGAVGGDQTSGHTDVMLKKGGINVQVTQSLELQ